MTRQARGSGAIYDSYIPVTPDQKSAASGDPGQKSVKVKRDFFGRAIAVEEVEEIDVAGGTQIDASSIAKSTAMKGKAKDNGVDGDGGWRIWVSFHEGFSNAVRKPITLRDLMESL